LKIHIHGVFFFTCLKKSPITRKKLAESCLHVIQTVLSDGAIALIARRQKQGVEDVKTWIREKYALQHSTSASEESTDESDDESQSASESDEDESMASESEDVSDETHEATEESESESSVAPPAVT